MTSLALLIGLLASTPQSQARIEGLGGQVRTLEVAALTLSDWRADGAWLRLPGASASAEADRADLQLVGGDRLQGVLRGGAKEDLLVKLPGGSILALPLDDLQSIVVSSRIPLGREAELQPPASGDRLLRALGGGLDRLDGTLVGFTDAGIEFESAAGVRTVAWPEVAALYVEDIGRRAARGATEHAVALDLAGGGALRGELTELDASGIALLRPGGQSIRLPWAALTGLSRDDGRFAWASQLPQRAEQPCRPFGDELGMVWSAARDRCVAGTALQAPDGIVARGIGMHAPASLTLDLSGRFRSLRGRVALDGSLRGLPAEGSVVFELRGDGKRLWQSPLVRGYSSAVDLPVVAVAEVRELELVVSDGGDGFAGDRANWLELRLSSE